MGNDYRRTVLDKTNRRCAYCGKLLHDEPYWHIDHIIPQTKGGQTYFDNLVPSCVKCNVRKHNKSIGEFKEWITDKIRRPILELLDQLDDFSYYFWEEDFAPIAFHLITALELLNQLEPHFLLDLLEEGEIE